MKMNVILFLRMQFLILSKKNYRIVGTALLSQLYMVMLASLSGCTTVATSGAQAIYNHKSIQKSVHDQYITMRANQALDIDSDHFKNANINVSTFNNVVLLTGQVPATWQKIEAEGIVRKIAGKAEVYNWVAIGKPASQWQRIYDTWITTKIKAELIASNELDAAQVKVITENGAVFLMGVLPLSEAREAANIASRTRGVRAVVKVFSYMMISKTPISS